MKKILIVDDVKGWRDYHSQVLSELFPDSLILKAESARKGYDLLMENNDKPFDIIISDLQMENDFEPKYAGEWFVEQVKTFKSYINTRVIISSGCYNIRQIAENLNTNYIPKRVAVTDINQYKETVIKLIKSS